MGVAYGSSVMAKRNDHRSTTTTTLLIDADGAIHSGQAVVTTISINRRSLWA